MESVKVKEFSHLKYFYDLIKSLIVSIFIGFKMLYRRLTMKRKNIRGQLALVTGGGKGLGREICLALAREGCNIAIVDIDVESSKETVEDCRSLGVKAQFYRCDVSDADAIDMLKCEVIQKSGTVDILVNNAGILFNRPIIEETPENIKKMVGVNLMSVFWVCRSPLHKLHIFLPLTIKRFICTNKKQATRAFLPSMIKKRRGHIVSM